jgi:hypothetical protein
MTEPGLARECEYGLPVGCEAAATDTRRMEEVSAVGPRRSSGGTVNWLLSAAVAGAIALSPGGGGGMPARANPKRG